MSSAGVNVVRPTSCEGYVTKRGHFRKSWRVRYLVLDGADLRVAYFESKTAFQNGSASKGEFYLSSIDKHAYVAGGMGAVGAQEKPFGFKMVGHAPKKGYTELDIFVETLADLTKWLEVAHNALESAAAMSRKAAGDGGGSATTKSLFGFSTTASPQQQLKAMSASKDELLKDALRELEGAKLIGREACTEMVVQGEKLDGIEANLGGIESDLDYGDKLLRRLKSPMLHLLARDLRRPPSPTKTHSSAGDGRAALEQFSSMGRSATDLQAAASSLQDDAGDGDELQRLARALGELEAQATLLNGEAVRSTQQIARIEERLTTVNDRVQRQTKQATSGIQRGGNIF